MMHGEHMMKMREMKDMMSNMMGMMDEMMGENSESEYKAKTGKPDMLAEEMSKRKMK